MKILITFFLFLFLVNKSYATAQEPDKIFYNGKEYKLFLNPLEEYFEKYPEKRPKSIIESTSLWRGYVASFELKDNQLFLKDIEIQYRDTTSIKRRNIKWKSVLTDVFPDSSMLRLTWITGLFIIPKGKIIDYVHMGYGSTYEEYTILEIDNGSLKKAKDFNYKEYELFKYKQFEAYKLTEDYKKTKAEFKKNGISDESVDEILHYSIIYRISKILAD